VLDKVKMLLGIEDDSKNDLINYHIESVTQKILNYTGQDTLPEGCNYIVIELVVARMKGTSQNVKTITRGDVSITYESTQELKPYEKELSNYMTVRII